MDTATKRRRVQRSPTPEYKLDDQDDSYIPYVPVAQRRQAKLAKLASRGADLDPHKAKLQQEEQEDKEDEEREEERLREKARKERTLLMEAQEVHDRKAVEGACAICYIMCAATWPDIPIDAKKTAEEKAEEADAEILAAIASRRKLASDLELARGVQYTEPMKTSYANAPLIAFASLIYPVVVLVGDLRVSFAKEVMRNTAGYVRNIISLSKATTSHRRLTTLL
jgi:ATP-dependent RNA helicase DDX41